MKFNHEGHEGGIGSGLLASGVWLEHPAITLLTQRRRAFLIHEGHEAHEGKLITGFRLWASGGLVEISSNIPLAYYIQPIAILCASGLKPDPRSPTTDLHLLSIPSSARGCWCSGGNWLSLGRL